MPSPRHLARTRVGVGGTLSSLSLTRSLDDVRSLVSCALFSVLMFLDQSKETVSLASLGVFQLGPWFRDTRALAPLSKNGSELLMEN